MSLIKKIIESWANVDGNVNSMDSLLTWIKGLNIETFVSVNEISIKENDFWFYDDINGEILNKKRSFFSIKGMRRFKDNECVCEQPIIIQPEIGYLGIICKEIDGVLNFLMQAKIEPGNINCVQISPTIQATKSNFTRAHGGNAPAYLEYFENASKYQIIYDQIQSEQAARFYKKRNRNMIMLINDDVEVKSNYKWMTLGQIKKLMEVDNLVNMDTRTVLSGLPLIFKHQDGQEQEQLKSLFCDKALYASIFKTSPIDDLPHIYHLINNYKMFVDVENTIVPLNQLTDWSIDEYGVVSNKSADFMVRYYDIEIEGREVRRWTQPLFKAIGMATFGLITKVNNGVRRFLVKIKDEIGDFDKVEIGPSVQWEPTQQMCADDIVETVFRNYIETQKGIMCGVILSEEGGRFYHEQNFNYIIEIEQNELQFLPTDYLWVNYSTLNYLVQVNNCLNIQLRNLLALLKL